MDEGDIYLQERVPIDPDDDYVSLTPKLQHVSMELLKKFFLELKQGNLRAFPQLGDPSYAPKFTPDSYGSTGKNQLMTYKTKYVL